MAEGGRTLAERFEEGPIPPREALRIGVGAARDLARAHARGTFHGALEPGRVFLRDDGGVEVLERGPVHPSGLPDARAHAYRAPEQWAGAAEDQRADVFALGVMLFRMLSGKLPFPGDDGGKAVRSPDPVPALDVPPYAMADLVARMLEKDPSGRPRDCGRVLAVLAHVQRQVEQAPEETPGSATAPRRPMSRAALLAVAGTILAALVAAFALRGSR